jgi:hypothetical protein
LLEIRNQDGNFFQATGPDMSVKLAMLKGFCTAAMMAASVGVASATKAW